MIHILTINHLNKYNFIQWDKGLDSLIGDLGFTEPWMHSNVRGFINRDGSCIINGASVTWDHDWIYVFKLDLDLRMIIASMDREIIKSYVKRVKINKYIDKLI